MKTNKLLLSAAFVAISVSGFNSIHATEADLLELSRIKEACNTLREQIGQVESRIDGNVASLEQIKATEFPVVRSYAHLSRDTEVLLESVHSHDLSHYFNLVRTNTIAKACAFIDSLQPENGQFLNLEHFQIRGFTVDAHVMSDATRDSFKAALQQAVNSVHPVVLAPVDATLSSLSKTKEQVDMEFVQAIEAFIDTIVPGADGGAVWLDSSAWGHTDGQLGSFKQALVNAIYQ